MDLGEHRNLSDVEFNLVALRNALTLGSKNLAVLNRTALKWRRFDDSDLDLPFVVVFSGSLLE